ncbi:MAG: hypothetical protein K6F93_02885 [Lachnospiraceae bacterium]|nr:hypothetical protein [Lachnospiraceae bacterium]
MKLLLFKSLITLMCLVGVAITGTETGHIVVMLLGLCYLMFSEVYMEKGKTVLLEVIHVPLVCSAFFYGPVAYLLPIACFFGTKKRLYVSAAATCAVYAYYFFSDYDPQMIMAFLLCTLAVLAELISEDMEKEKQGNIILRDSSKEREIGLEEENRLLAKNRDMMVKNATLSERNRIAREIHDNVGHMLTRSILQLGALQVINKDENVGMGLSSMKETLDSAMNSIRNSVHDLHDESVDIAGAMSEILADATGFSTKLDMDIVSPIPREIKYAFIAITREAVNNSLKHSNGDEIAVSVREHPGYWRLEVSDNGKGPGNIERGKGIGLESMDERARAIGALLRIDDSKGVKIIVTAFRTVSGNKN